MTPAELLVDDQPLPADVQFLEDRINEFNFVTTGSRDGRLLSSFVRDDAGQIIAGLYGWTWAGCCEVRFLWVQDSLRGQGYGSRLLQAAEREALARGCETIVLATHSFQAPLFYQKHGYQIVGEFRNYPRGYSQFFLQKHLKDNSMDKRKLNDSLKQLHTELDQAEPTDETRERLQSLSGNVKQLINNENSEPTHYKSLLAQLNDSIVHFEGTHPTLALAISQAINALVDGGV
jgi:GNAT superfamily N-acetyltransferase